MALPKCYPTFERHTGLITAVDGERFILLSEEDMERLAPSTLIWETEMVNITSLSSDLYNGLVRFKEGANRLGGRRWVKHIAICVREKDYCSVEWGEVCP